MQNNIRSGHRVLQLTRCARKTADDMPQEKDAKFHEDGASISPPIDRAPVQVSASALAALALIVSSNPLHELLMHDSRAANALRNAARVLALDARAVDERRGERFVIALRAAWPRIAPDRRRRDGHGDLLWDRLVTLCLEEFYDVSRLTTRPKADGRA